MTEKIIYIINITVAIIALGLLLIAGYSIFTKIHNGWKSYIWEIISILLAFNAYFQYRYLRVSQAKVKRYEKRFFNID
jgi:type IV secretory pathway VirB2 component (pilin)